MLISPEQEALIGRVFETYLTEHHRGDILQLVADTNDEIHHPVVVNAMTLFEANMEVGDYFNAYPSDVLAIFDKVLHRTATELSQSAAPSGRQGTKEQRMRCTLHARITGLPVCPELTRDTIPRSRDVGHFLSVTGTVIRTSVAKVLEYERDYMCTKCRHVFTVQADFDQFYTFAPPVTCPNPDVCNSFKFSCLSGGSEPAVCRDYQEIKIQEQVQRLSVGSIPRSMVVVLEDDLVDSCKSGDDVTVYGVMCQRWRPFYDGTRCDVELVLKANNIEVNNQQAAAALLMKDVQQEFEDFWDTYKHDPIAGRNQILLSLCPQVYGMYVIKLAVAMVLAGGVQRIDSSGTKIRGECHMLLVGDPGTGKSQFLKYAAKIMPRSVLTAGIGSTSAGLTVAAVKDGGEWHLEAGALVLSDGGLCCIDEFNSIKEHDRISIHEAMEQQSISVAKAGIVCKLNTRSTILAATNPKGQYNPSEPLSVNVALASPLLSRFDLVLVLLDTRNSEWDRVISSFILENRGLPADSSSLWSMEKMKAYFSVIKRLQPQVSEEANSILTRYYQLQRQSNGRNAARTTIRMLESLSRLAEAHARLMYRATVTIEDAVMAVSVMECSMQGGALLGNVNALLTSFPADPRQQYQTQCQILLEGLNLPLLLQKETGRLARLKSNTSQFDHYQHQLRDTNNINKMVVESGLDWFHSITPSVSPDDLTSPIITSTQVNRCRKPNSSQCIKQPDCQTERDVHGNTDSTLHHDGTSSASEDGNRNRKKNENFKEKSSAAQEMNESERRTDEQHPETPGCVFQKVSKGLRGRRLRTLDLNNLQGDKDGQGGRGARALSTDSPSKTVTDVITTTSDPHSSSTPSSGKTCPPSDHLIQENQASGKGSRSEREDRGDQTGKKNICAALREKMTAEAETGETGKDLHTKLSGFIFKPRKMRPLHNRDFNTSSELSAELQPDCDPDTRDLHMSAGSRDLHMSAGSRDLHMSADTRDLHMSADTRDLHMSAGSRDLHMSTGSRGNQRPVSCDESASPLTDTQRKDRKTDQNLDQSLSGGSRRKQVSSVSEVAGSEDSADLRSAALQDDVLTFGKSVGRIKRSNDRENLCQQQRPGSSAGDQTGTSPVTSSSTVASSTLAKLSRFSFTCSAEPTTTAQTKETKHPAAAVEQGSFKGNAAEGPRGNSDIEETPKHSQLGKKMKTGVTMDRVQDVQPPPATVPTAGRDHGHGTVKQTEPAPAAKLMTDGLVEHEHTASLRKRKCFELGPAASGAGGSRAPFSGLSLFGSVELSNDVLDTDWDQEVSKKARV